MGKKLSELINVNNILFLNTDDMEDTINILAKNAFESNKISNKEVFVQAVLEREELVSTGIGLGVALPHAKLTNIEDFFIIVGINKEGIDWDAIDRNPVGLVFLIGGPEKEDSPREYLQLISKLMLLIKNRDRRLMLLNAKDENEVATIFEKF